MRALLGASALLCASALTAAAAPGGESVRPLFWEDCIDLAARANPDLESSRAGLEASRARYNGSLNGLLPRVSLTNRVSDSDSASPASRYSADGTASLDLFNLETYARVGSASAAVRRADAEKRLVSAQLRLALRRAFADLHFAQEQVAVAERIRALRLGNADMVALKYDSGRESRGNMLRARAEAVEARAAASQAERALRVARQELGRRLGLDSFERLVATGTLDAGMVPALPEPGRLEGFHPLLAQRVAARDAAKAGVSESRSAFFPALSASYSRNASGPTYFPNARRGWSAAAVLSLPLFGGGPTAAFHSATAAKRGLEASEADLRSASQQVRSDLEASWAGLADGIEALEVQRGFLEAARQRNAEASVRYSSGLMTFENWEQVVSDLVAFERSSIRARRDAVVARAEWEGAAGLALEE